MRPTPVPPFVAFVLTLGFALSFALGGARTAQAANACADQNLAAQKSREAGKLGEARKALEACMAKTCPAVVRDDCTQRFDELERVQPTVVLAAKTAGGDDVRDVRVTMDGVEIATSLDGRAIPLDPGEHVFVFERMGETEVTKTLIVREGEKGRVETVTFGAAADAAAVEPPPEATSSAGTDALFGVGIGAGVVGLVGLGLGIGGAVVASSAWDESKTACASSTQCPDHPAAVQAHDRAVDWATVSTVGFVAGGILAATGITLILVGSFQDEGAPATESALAIELVPSPTFGGGGFSVRGTFR